MESPNIKNTFWEIELGNGEKTTLTLNFARLYKLRAKNRNLYDRYNKIIMGEIKEEIDNVVIIYVAYVCAHIDENYLSFEQFLDVAPYDRAAIGIAIERLLTPSKKKQASQQHFKEPQRK